MSTTAEPSPSTPPEPEPAAVAAAPPPLETDSPPETAAPARPSPWQRALDRHVPQILGLYAGAATSAVLFTEFLAERYALSPHLVDVLLAAAVLAVPAVAVLAYAHGAPGEQRWSHRQLAALAGNAVLGVGVLLAAFWGTPLGATTETVRVETADGVVERTVAKAAFRKRLVVSDFEGDGDLGRAASYALVMDLDQDLFLTVMSSTVLRRPLRTAGFETTAGAPAALLRDAAADAHVDRLVTGRVERTAGGFRVEAQLQEVDGPRRPRRYAVEGPDLPRLLDDVSAQIRADLDLPEVHLAESDDRPVEDVLTASVPALEAWAAGWHAEEFQDDAQTAVERYRAAVAADTTFAQGYVALGLTLTGLAQTDEGLAAFAAAQRHRYRLPERGRFRLDANMAVQQQRPDDALATVEEWAALYPDDAVALSVLGGLLRRADRGDEAVEVQRRLAALDAGNPYQILGLASMLYGEERYDEARAEAERYIGAAPDDAMGYSLLGWIKLQGDPAGAIDALRQATRLAPTDLRYTLTLGQGLMVTGAWDEAERTIRRSLSGAEAADRAGAHSALAHLYDLRGRYRQAADALDAQWKELAPSTPRVDLLAAQLGEGYHYARAGRTDDFERFLRDALAQPEAQTSPSYRGTVARAAAYAYANTDRSAEVFRYAATADSVYQAYGLEAGRPFVRAVRGIGYANRKDWRRAIADLAPYAADNPTDFYRVLPLAQAYAAAGDAGKARATAESMLVGFPAHPGAHLLLARLDARRDPAAARRHLDQALKAWDGADAGFRPARVARALRQRLAAA